MHGKCVNCGNFSSCIACEYYTCGRCGGELKPLDFFKVEAKYSVDEEMVTSKKSLDHILEFEKTSKKIKSGTFKTPARKEIDDEWWDE